MTPVSHYSFWHNQNGFTLLEILLSVFALSGITLGLVQITQDFLEDQQVRATAEHITIVDEAAYSYVMDNFDDIYTNQLGGTGGVGNIFEIPIEDSGGLTHFLKNGADYLPASFNALNPTGQTVSTIVRNVADRTVEIITITSGTLVEDSKIESIASTVGGNGGLWSAIDRDPGAGDTTDDIAGVYGMWSVAVTDLTTAGWGGGATPPTIAGGSYLASYRWINYVDEMGDYLYRQTVPLLTAANVMQTDLNLNNFSIDGIDDLSVDNLTVTNAADFAGSVSTAGVLNITGNLNIEGTTGTLAIIPDGAQVTDTLDANVQIDSDVMSVGAGTLSANDTTANTSMLDINSASVQVTTVQVLNTTSVPSLVTTIDTDFISNSFGQVVTEDVSVTTINATGDSDTQEITGSGTINANNLLGGGTTSITTLDVTTQFECNSGC